MALTSPGVEVQVIDQSQYLPAAPGTVPLVVLATAQNKADPTGTGIATGTTAANAGKLYQVTSQRDLVTLYGNPFFYTTTNGTPLQGYELNEYGLLAAYSVLGVTNRCYVLRADIDLASLVGTTSRPSGFVDNGTYWLDTTTSTWGINEFDATTGTFTDQTPIVITDDAYMIGDFPIQSIGQVGDYAVYALNQSQVPYGQANEFFYKAVSNQWVKVGSPEWKIAIPTVQGTESYPSLTAGNSFSINLSGSFTFVVSVPISPNNTVSGVASAINALGYSYLQADVRSGKLCILLSIPESATGSPAQFVTISTSTGTVLTDLGITPGTYNQPAVSWGTSAQQPLWQSGQSIPRPTGSVWFKVGGSGLNTSLKEWNSLTESWDIKTITYSTLASAAQATLDPTGGQAIPEGTIYGQYKFNGQTNLAPVYYWKRGQTGPTVITGTNTNPNFSGLGPVGSGPYYLYVRTSLPNQSTVSDVYTVIITEGSDATDFVTSWLGSNIPYTTAEVTSSGAIQIIHTLGGSLSIDDIIQDGPGKFQSTGVMTEAGFIPGSTTGVEYSSAEIQNFTGVPQDSTTGSGTNLEINLTVTGSGFYGIASNTFNNAGTGYAIGDHVTFLGTSLGGTTPDNDLEIEVTSIGIGGAVSSITFISGAAPQRYTIALRNWLYLEYIANEGAPVANPANNTNWFYSVVDEADILVNYNGAWKGYKNQNYDSNGFPTPTGANATDPNGPIVTSGEPTTQSDGTALVFGDLWIDTSDLENYPAIYRWQSVNGTSQWVLIDNSDQLNPNGIVFADARWATNGTTSVTSDPIPTIQSLLTSNYLDLDVPSASLYPTGMLLFNTRRSGYNVKQFKENYFSYSNFPGESLPTESNAWVSVSGLQSNGAPYMGRKAQRAMVVEALRSAIGTNVDIRDEDNFFNLIAAPNYPELQPDMVTLNADRGETGYILGDSPLGLSDNATAIQNWATNAAGATSTGEEGLVTRNTYMGIFYPSGIASDLSGNLVAVPASHMMLRTFVRNDTVAYPWLAAAGTRRGIIDNAANIGYVNRQTGEFQVIKTRTGVRDVLYSNFINPLVFFTGQGLLNYGNKTSFNSSSALDRTNVARLVAYMRRQLTLAGRPYVFEPNDAFTRGQIANTVESLCLDLVAKRGIYDYLVVCDESNNTPARIDRNELWVDVAIEPVKAVEFIYIPLRILNTGELS